MYSKFIGNVRGPFNFITLVEMFFSIFCILLGIIFFTTPNASSIIVSIIVGLALIVNGVSSIYAYMKKGDIVLYNNNFIYGFIFILLGLVSMFLGNILNVMLGIYLITVAIQRFNYSLFLRLFNESTWVLTAVVGGLYIIIAIITMMTSKELVATVAGVWLLGFGVINLTHIMLLRKRSKYFIA